MANPDEVEDDNSVSLNLYRACDWSRPRSWLTLLGLGLIVGTVSAFFGGLFTVLAFDQTVATIDAEFLAHAAGMMIVALIVFGVIFASMEIGFILWDKRNPDFRWTPHRIEALKGQAIALILQFVIMMPPLIAVLLLSYPDEPGGRDFSSSGLAVATIAAVIVGPRVMLAHVTNGNLPNRDMTD